MAWISLDGSEIQTRNITEITSGGNPGNYRDGKSTTIYFGNGYARSRLTKKEVLKVIQEAEEAENRKKTADLTQALVEALQAPRVINKASPSPAFSASQEKSAKKSSPKTP